VSEEHGSAHGRHPSLQKVEAMGFTGRATPVGAAGSGYPGAGSDLARSHGAVTWART
jgi:hypothetical protein